MRVFRQILLLAAMGLLVSACGGGGSSATSPVSNTYSTTSSKGDYSEWTLRGSSLNATLDVVNTGGSIDYTYTIAATCGAEDTFGVRTCAIDSSSCMDGVAACSGNPSGNLYVREVPGVALYAKLNTDTQLHVGFAKDNRACSANVSGDYTMIRTGLGVNENFGIYRSDSNFINILHADFGFDTADVNMSQTVAYRTGTESEALADNGCVNGVRVRTLPDGVSKVRSMITANGLFVLDLPATQGGALAFKVSNAASLADFAGRSFGGINFPDIGSPLFVNVEFGSVNSGKIDFSATDSNGASGSLSLLPLSGTATLSMPAYPDFSIAPAGYATSTLATTYATPENIPGLFKLDGLSDSGRVIIAAMKVGGKVVGMGMVYNYRTTGDINPATGTNFPADGLYNTGNFLLFEK